MNTTITLSQPLESTVSNATTFRYAFHRSISAAGHDWDIAAPDNNIFLQRSFLAVVESFPPDGMQFGYLVFYKNDIPVGVALCQIKYFKGDDNIADLETPRKQACFFNGLALWFKKWVAGMAAADILICGNMLLTGEHGHYFDAARIDRTEATNLLEKALTEVVDIMGASGVKMPVVLIKDVAPAEEIQRKIWVRKGFTEFEIQPNMVMNLPYKTYDEYLGVMSTKYRTRAKRAIKKLDGIERRELSAAEIGAELPTIYHLYKEIANNAGFNMVDLNKEYLLGLKKHFGEHFRLFAYYLDGKLVAFYSTISNGDELEAHFLGYEKSLNHDYQLYLNILYDIVKVGITNGHHQVVFARTALEIKSSVGATAHNLYCYLRHQNNIANKFAGPILEYLKPIEEWLPRHPFKEESH